MVFPPTSSRILFLDDINTRDGSVFSSVSAKYNVEVNKPYYSCNYKVVWSGTIRNDAS